MKNKSNDYSQPLREKKFRYKGGTDKTPRVLITSQNQHQTRGFNIHYLTPKQIGMVRNEWRKVQNQVWKTTTKERVAMNRLPKKVANSFRSYSADNISQMKG